MPGASAKAALAGSRFSALEWVEATGSTNADLLERARAGDPEGLVLVADHQTAGRGRLGRSWEAPPGASLLVSVLLRPPAGVAGAVTMAAGVAMVDAVAAIAQVDARLKWPNDLVVTRTGGETRKLAGILAEADWPARSNVTAGWSEPPPDERVVVVVGVGLNVNWPAELPPELEEIATACNLERGSEVDREQLLVLFLRGLDARYTALVGSGSSAQLLDEWRVRSATLGQRVRVDLGHEDVEGVAADVTDDGRLIVVTPDGARTVAVGDVVHLRPA